MSLGASSCEILVVAEEEWEPVPVDSALQSELEKSAEKRYTDEDEEYVKIRSIPTCDPPIQFAQSGRWGGGGQRRGGFNNDQRGRWQREDRGLKRSHDNGAERKESSERNYSGRGYYRPYGGETERNYEERRHDRNYDQRRYDRNYGAEGNNRYAEGESGK